MKDFPTMMLWKSVAPAHRMTTSRISFIHPVLPEADGTTKNVFPCKVERVIEDVFSYILIVSTKEEARIRVDVTKEQWQQYQKHISGNKIWIGIDEKDVMLLK